MASALREFSIFLLLVGSMYHVSATTFSIENLALANRTVGGVRFEQELGNRTILAVMCEAKDFIVKEFSLSPEKLVDHVVLYVEEMDGIAYRENSTIHLSAGYVGTYKPGNATALLSEITGIMYHEMTHVFQNKALGLPVGVIEGIADFIRLRAGYGEWARQVAGFNWDSGYSVTAFFFDWIDLTKTRDFVNKLNQKIGEAIFGWNVDVFVQLTGKNVTSLWSEYQISY